MSGITTIVELLKHPDVNARVSLGNRWLYFDDSAGNWVIRQQDYGQKYSRVIFESESEEKAVEALMDFEFTEKEVNNDHL
jgi:phage pi2 protein 07